jgi:hypothetical protein
MTTNSQWALQVKIDGQWRYVFSNNRSEGNIKTTPSREKSLLARDATWFASHYANHEFAVEKNGTTLSIRDLDTCPECRGILLMNNKNYGHRDDCSFR